MAENTNRPLTATFLAVPDELLLEIAALITGPHRNTWVINLALTSRRFRPIAKESLLCAPSFHIAHIHRVLHLLSRRPALLPKIRVLELFGSSEGRIPYAQTTDVAYFQRKPPSYPSICFSDPLQKVELCKRLEKAFADHVDEDWKTAAWSDRVRKDIIPNFLAVLLLILPNLRELKCAASWLMDFAVFDGCMTPEASITRYPARLAVYRRHLYFIAAKLQQRLEVLEFPADLANFDIIMAPSEIFDFRGFTQLRELTLTTRLLHWPQHRRVVADPVCVLPRSLELLRISEANERTGEFVHYLCDARARRGHFPALGRIELYYEDLRYVTVARSGLRSRWWR